MFFQHENRFVTTATLRFKKSPAKRRCLSWSVEKRQFIADSQKKRPQDEPPEGWQSGLIKPRRDVSRLG